MGRESRRKRENRMQSQAPTGARASLARVKQATVAIAAMLDVPSPSRETPYQIVGSGFCVHERGVIISCRHVFEGFMEKSIGDQLAAIPEEEKSKPIKRVPAGRVIQPFAVFHFAAPESRQILVACAGVETMVALADLDIGVARLTRHEAFARGFPV